MSASALWILACMSGHPWPVARSTFIPSSSAFLDYQRKTEVQCCTIERSKPCECPCRRRGQRLMTTPGSAVHVTHWSFISTFSFLLCVLYPLDDAAILASPSVPTPVNKVARSASIQLYSHCSSVLSVLGSQTLAQTMWLLCAL